MNFVQILTPTKNKPFLFIRTNFTVSYIKIADQTGEIKILDYQ